MYKRIRWIWYECCRKVKQKAISKGIQWKRVVRQRHKWPFQNRWGMLKKMHITGLIPIEQSRVSCGHTHTHTHTRRYNTCACLTCDVRALRPVPLTHDSCFSFSSSSYGRLDDSQNTFNGRFGFPVLCTCIYEGYLGIPVFR